LERAGIRFIEADASGGIGVRLAATPAKGCKQTSRLDANFTKRAQFAAVQSLGVDPLSDPVHMSF
jgi:hypothetical protein